MMPASPVDLRAVGYALGSLAFAFLAALIVIAGATRWVPAGAADIDHIALPIVAFPFVWSGLGLWLYGARYRGRAWAIVGAITAAHLGLAVAGFLMGT